MNNLKKLIFLSMAFIILSISLSVVHVPENIPDLNTKVQAKVGGDPCALNGVKTWGGGLFGQKGKNCWCDTIRKPIAECETDPGEVE